MNDVVPRVRLKAGIASDQIVLDDGTIPYIDRGRNPLEECAELEIEPVAAAEIGTDAPSHICFGLQFIWGIGQVLEGNPDLGIHGELGGQETGREKREECNYSDRSHWFLVWFTEVTNLLRIGSEMIAAPSGR